MSYLQLKRVKLRKIKWNSNDTLLLSNWYYKLQNAKTIVPQTQIQNDLSDVSK